MDQANTQLNTEGSVMWKIKCTLFALIGFKKGTFTSCCCCRWFISKCEHIYKSRCFGNLLVWSIHGCVKNNDTILPGVDSCKSPTEWQKKKRINALQCSQSPAT